MATHELDQDRNPRTRKNCSVKILSNGCGEVWNTWNFRLRAKQDILHAVVLRWRISAVGRDGGSFSIDIYLSLGVDGADLDIRTQDLMF